MNATTTDRLGLIVMLIDDPSKPLTRCIDEDLDLAVACYPTTSRVD